MVPRIVDDEHGAVEQGDGHWATPHNRAVVAEDAEVHHEVS